jgi:hypothetical protein
MEAESNGFIEILGFLGLRRVEEQRKGQFPESGWRCFIGGKGRNIGVDFRSSQGPGEDVVECAVVFLPGGGIEGAPDIASVGWWLRVEVVEPLKNWAPGSWLGLMLEGGHEVRIGLGPLCRVAQRSCGS